MITANGAGRENETVVAISPQTSTTEVLPNLAELAEEANREHQAVLQAGLEMIEHAIKAGDALLAAKSQCAWGTWSAWLAEHFKAHNSTASSYMRLATYKEIVRRDLTNVTFVDAVKYLRGLPRADGRYDSAGGGRGFPQEVRDEVLRLHKQGVPNMDIARLLGLKYGTVYSWTHADTCRRLAERRRVALARRRAERQALLRQQRDEAARKIGGTTAHAYSLLRKTAQALDRAHRQATDREVRVAITSALSKLHRAEDDLVRALGIE